MSELNPEGFGKPLRGIDDLHDENWWIREKLRREQVELELPPALAIREAKREFLEGLPSFIDEALLRCRIEELNKQITHVNRVATIGPPSTTTVIDIEKLLDEWRRSL